MPAQALHFLPSIQPPDPKFSLSGASPIALPPLSPAWFILALHPTYTFSFPTSQHWTISAPSEKTHSTLPCQAWLSCPSPLPLQIHLQVSCKPLIPSPSSLLSCFVIGRIFQRAGESALQPSVHISTCSSDSQTAGGRALQHQCNSSVRALRTKSSTIRRAGP